MGGTVRRVLGDRYELVELVATGGMGRVWRARDRRLDRTVAVKVLRSEYTDDAVSLARFRAEAQVSARLRHRNIAALHDYGEATGPDGEVCAFLVMELVEGESLAARLAREPRLPPDVVLDVVDQTAAALSAAHEAGVVHRDVKPGNVLLGSDGVVRITDFGIAWTATSVPLTRTGQVVGTACYLSPEQAEGRHASPASDVYALGMVAYECLAGRRAFDGDNPVQIALRQIREQPAPLPDDVPDGVRVLVDRALVKDPDGRLRDGSQVRAAVADVRAGRRLEPAPPPRTRELVLPPARRRHGRRALAPLATLLVGAGIGVGALQLVAGPAAVVPPAAAGEESPRATGVDVDAAALIGRPADEVEAELVGLGLGVARVEQPTTGSAPGLVTAVSPAGRLATGTLVTLTVATEPPAPAQTPAPAAPAGAGPADVGAPPAQETPAPAPVPPAPGTPAAGGPGPGGGVDQGEGPGGGNPGSGNGTAPGNANPGNGNGPGNANPGNGNGPGNANPGNGNGPGNANPGNGNGPGSANAGGGNPGGGPGRANAGGGNAGGGRG
ncbi:serine/threonine-protein kinase [Trujillonella humicola]|uniref:serine/threonine-protein kinase n=1 Tax=Trujillonella humicola TaxID=3383699 RepID=UPI003906B85E